jgi:hypothetical protein
VIDNEKGIFTASFLTISLFVARSLSIDELATMVSDSTQCCPDYGYGDAAPDSSSKYYAYSEAGNSVGPQPDHYLDYEIASTESKETSDNGVATEQSQTIRSGRRGSVTKYSLDFVQNAKKQYDNGMSDVDDSCHKSLGRKESTVSGDDFEADDRISAVKTEKRKKWFGGK